MKFDRNGKMRKYQQIPSLREYILVAQDEPDIEQLVRKRSGKWEQTILTGLDAELVLASVAARIPLTAIYAGVTFPERD